MNPLFLLPAEGEPPPRHPKDGPKEIVSSLYRDFDLTHAVQFHSMPEAFLALL